MRGLDINLKKNTMLSVANVILALLLVFYHFTDYSWIGTVLDVVFPLFVGLIAIASRDYLETGLGSVKRILNGLSIWVNIILGIVPYILMIIFFPLTLFSLQFIASEFPTERVVQSAWSPDGRIVAEVIYRDVGAYASGSGRFRVVVTNKYFPLLERDVFNGGRRSCGEENKCVEWLDNRTLYIFEDEKVIEIGLVKFSISLLLLFAIYPILIIMGFLYHLFV